MHNKTLNLLKNAIVGALGEDTLTAVILAGGTGERMHSDIPKQFLAVSGKPIIVHTLLSFQNCSCVRDIIIVAGENQKEIYRDYCKNYGLTKVRKVVVGGSTRQESAFAGLLALKGDCRYVAVHDGARCMITTEEIKRVFTDAKIYGAAAAASKVKDTVKITDAAGLVLSTTEREHTWAVQTPQIFKADIYRAASYSAKEKKLTVTDDCMMAEACGFPVKLTECSPENLKITTPEDRYTASCILQDRKEKTEKGKKDNATV